MSGEEFKQNKVAIIGAGVIGSGWILRFLLNGWDVHVYDLDLSVKKDISELYSDTKPLISSIYKNTNNYEGKLTYFNNLEDTVRGVSWIQESLPERKEIKIKLFSEISKYCHNDTVIASSTSGFKPSELNVKISNKEQILVVHPYNPVYLLPGVEVVGAGDSNNRYKQKAMKVLKSLGMKPIILSKEIDAHIGDRLLEALWRESLWLINDDIAKTEDIDELITHTFGLRWSQMGLFETYRLGGGKGGMSHFLKQFAPTLSLPWSKLTDVPELNDKLIRKISNQSELQSGKYKIKELQKIRDRNLVGILRTLTRYNWAAGKTINLWEKQFKNLKENKLSSDTFFGYKTKVKKKWIDYNGHMTEFRYLHVISKACDYFLKSIGFNREYLLTGFSFYTVETHLRHLKECKENEMLSVNTQIIFYNNKKLHVWHSVINDRNEEIATGEQFLLHVAQKTQKITEIREDLFKKLEKLAKKHKQIPMPFGIGRYVGQKS